MIKKYESVNQLYLELLPMVANNGILLGKTRDIHNLAFELTNIDNNILFAKKNWKWAFQECFDRMSGCLGFNTDYYNPGRAFLYRPSWKRKLKKENGYFDYAYGEVFSKQIDSVIGHLKKNKSSREAIINVWSGKYLMRQSDFQRRPCTLTLHFMIRQKKLFCYANFRTNDLINLLPYDIFHHTFLQKYIALALGLDYGSYTHFASHAYYPKKRESEGRNFINRFVLELENVEARYGKCQLTPFNNNQNFSEFQLDLQTAIEISFNENQSTIINPYLNNMLNFIFEERGSCNNEFKILQQL